MTNRNRRLGSIGHPETFTIDWSALIKERVSISPQPLPTCPWCSVEMVVIGTDTTGYNATCMACGVYGPKMPTPEYAAQAIDTMVQRIKLTAASRTWTATK